MILRDNYETEPASCDYYETADGRLRTPKLIIPEAPRLLPNAIPK